MTSWTWTRLPRHHQRILNDLLRRRRLCYHLSKPCGFFEPLQYHHSPPLTPAPDRNRERYDGPLIEIDDSTATAPPSQPARAPPFVPPAPSGSYTASDSSLRPSPRAPQSTHLHALLTHAVPPQSTARLPSSEPLSQISAQPRPSTAHPGEFIRRPRSGESFWHLPTSINSDCLQFTEHPLRFHQVLRERPHPTWVRRSFSRQVIAALRQKEPVC